MTSPNTLQPKKRNCEECLFYVGGICCNASTAYQGKSVQERACDGFRSIMELRNKPAMQSFGSAPGASLAA